VNAARNKTTLLLNLRGLTLDSFLVVLLQMRLANEKTPASKQGCECLESVHFHHRLPELFELCLFYCVVRKITSYANASKYVNSLSLWGGCGDITVSICQRIITLFLAALKSAIALSATLCVIALGATLCVITQTSLLFVIP
jgi:hypothetical protein